jgi:uncharacterized protein YdhG (YjbR/CyaY superfamily)
VPIDERRVFREVPDEERFMQSKVTNVDAYVDEAPTERRAALNRLRVLCLKTFPNVDEGIDYGMVVYKRDGVMRVAFASQKNYISVYGLGAAIVDRHRAEFKGIEPGKGCIKYRKPEAIDFALIEKMMIESRDSGHIGC